MQNRPRVSHTGTCQTGTNRSNKYNPITGEWIITVVREGVSDTAQLVFVAVQDSEDQPLFGDGSLDTPKQSMDFVHRGTVYPNETLQIQRLFN